jgi:hypothetical protein
VRSSKLLFKFFIPDVNGLAGVGGAIYTIIADSNNKNNNKDGIFISKSGSQEGIQQITI